MMSLTTSQPVAKSYAARKNARFNSKQSNIVSIEKRWKETYNSLPVEEQEAIDIALEAAKAEFRRRNPNLDSFKKLKKELARSIDVPMSDIEIDGTMQRLLNIGWVLELLNNFVATKVIPIQVYQPDAKVVKYLAWDGQHTLVLLWLIATQLFAEDPATVSIPVNIYSSHAKPEMRMSFVDLNSSVGKHGLDQFDIFEQMVYGVRIDGSDKPRWVEAADKQAVVEKHGLFLTSKKFGDHTEPGAIGRMQEVNKLSTDALSWLCTYLVAVGAQTRPVEEKEMVMMAYFFESCRLAKLKIDNKFIFNVAGITKKHWGADFGPTSRFWAKASTAYANWHANFVGGTSRFNKEPVHGYPFLIAQLRKDMPGVHLPGNRSSSEFKPMAKDLF